MPRDTPRCPLCGHVRPSVLGLSGLLGRLFRPDLSFTQVFFLSTVVLWLVLVAASVRAGGIEAIQGGGMFGLLGPDLRILLKAGAESRPFITYHHQLWRLVVPMFLHFGIIHIAFNMMWLRHLGPVVEEVFGKAGFVLIYVGSGVSGSLASYFLGAPQGVGAGASGAIFGVMTALLVYGWRRGGTFGRALMTQMGLWAAVGFLFGLSMPGIDNWAHGGGALGGASLGFMLQLGERHRRGEGQWRMLAAAAALLLCVVSLGAAMVSAAFGPSLDEMEGKLQLWAQDDPAGTTAYALDVALRGVQGDILTSAALASEGKRLGETFERCASWVNLWARAGERPAPQVDPGKLAASLQEFSRMLAKGVPVEELRKHASGWKTSAQEMRDALLAGPKKN